MTITVASLGLRTAHIAQEITSVATAHTFTDFANAVKDAITGTNPVKATGWTLLDEFTAGRIHTQVFRALNKDGLTYKNIILRYDHSETAIYTSTCESWNDVTHVATNECWTFGNHAPIPYKLNYSDILIMVAPRWCVLTSVIHNEVGMWAGVFEMEREDVADTAAENYPCWGWMSSALWTLGSTVRDLRPLGATNHTLICMPRVRTGGVGINAAMFWTADFGLFSNPNIFDQVSKPAANWYLSNSVAGLEKTKWDETKLLTLPIKPVHAQTVDTVSNYGKIFGLKTTNPQGAQLNKMPIAIDTDGNFASDGTVSDHWVLNTHHAQNPLPTGAFSGNPKLVSRDINLGWQARTIVSTGNAYYAIQANGTGMVKVGAIALPVTSLGAANGTKNDMKYDGERYIYITTSTGVVRIDTFDDSQTFLEIAGGVQAIAITSTHIFVGELTATLTPRITRIRRDNFTIESTNGTITLATYTSDSVILRDMVADKDDNVYAIANVATATRGKLVKLPAATPQTPVYLTTQINQIALSCGLAIVGDTQLMVHLLTTTANLRTVWVNLSDFTTLTQTDTAINAASASPYRLLTVKLAGEMFVVTRTASFTGKTCSAQNGTNLFNNHITNGTALNFLGTGSIGACFDDEVRIFTGLTNGFRIWEGIYTEQDIGSTTKLGQMVLPA